MKDWELRQQQRQYANAGEAGAERIEERIEKDLEALRERLEAERNRMLRKVMLRGDAQACLRMRMAHLAARMPISSVPRCCRALSPVRAPSVMWDGPQLVVAARGCGRAADAPVGMRRLSRCPFVAHLRPRAVRCP